MTEVRARSRDAPRSATLRRLLRSAAAAVVAAVMVWQPAFGYPVLTQTPDPVNAGDQVTLTLTDTLPLADPVLGGVQYFDLQATYDPTYLSLTNVLLGNLLAGWDAPVPGPVIQNSMTSATVIISDSECPTCNDASGGPDSVVMLVFQSFAGDPTTTDNVSLDILPNDIGAPNAYNFSSGTEVTDRVSISGAAVTSVPEPPMETLFLVGLAALLTLRSRFPRHRAVQA